MDRTALCECLRCISRCAVERMHCGNQAENVQFKILDLLMDMQDKDLAGMELLVE